MILNHTKPLGNDSTLVDPAEIAVTLSALHPVGSTFEIRGVGIQERSSPWTNTLAGYFSDPEAAARAVAGVDYVRGAFYVTLQAVKSEIISRCADRLHRQKGKDDELTKDKDVVAYQWLPIDCDTERAGGIMASDTERHAAEMMAAEIAYDLEREGWGRPILADSGSGRHLDFKTKLPMFVKGENPVQQLLEALQHYYGTEAVKIDRSVFNPARVWRLYGTWNRKGDDDAKRGRPHRRSCILERPDEFVTITRPMIDHIIAKYRPKTVVTTSNAGWTSNGKCWSVDDVSRWLDSYLRPVGISIAEPTAKGSTTQWNLTPCPMTNDHGASYAAAVFRGADGALGFKCFGERCSSYGWKDLRAKYEARTHDQQSAAVDAQQDSPRSSRSTQRPPIIITTDTDVIPSVLRDDGRTEIANARRFVRDHGDKVRYVAEWGKWFVWDGKRWKLDVCGVAQEFAKQTSQKLWRELADAMRSGGKDAASEYVTAVRYCRSMAAAAGLTHTLTLASTDPRVVVSHDHLDVNPWLLNCDNGTIDLRSGDLLPHNPHDLLTKLSPVAYDPLAAAPRWLRFLHRIMGGRESLIGYLRRLVGLCLTGTATEHILPIFHGTGANGKSVLIGIMLDMLGDEYAMQATPDLLLARSGEAHPTALADLCGRRFVAAVETGDGRRLDEALVKSLTGGDRIRARRMREDFWQFSPTHKLVVATNHKPIVRGDDNGIWRRLRLVPFSVTIPPDERDITLGGKLRDELPGILAWAVRGCVEWQAGGLNDPPEVQAATVQFRTDSDTVQRWFDDCCVRDDKASETAKNLAANCKAWTDANGESEINPTRLGRWLTDHGFPKDPHKGRATVRLGVRLMAS